MRAGDTWAGSKIVPDLGARMDLGTQRPTLWHGTRLWDVVEANACLHGGVVERDRLTTDQSWGGL